MRIGYSYWGFLGDHKEDKDGNELSTPDGNASYSWALIWRLQQDNHLVYMMQEDRDWAAFKRYGKFDFASFATEKRFNSYLGMGRTMMTERRYEATHKFPDLDLLLLEWRFPIPGRNTENDQHLPEFQPDLQRQTELLAHYSKTKTKIVIWDLDHKLLDNEERNIRDFWGRDDVVVLETSTVPRKGLFPRVGVEPPMVAEELLKLTPRALDPSRKMVYVGSRYERDEIIQEWIKPVSDRFPGQVHFYGNWDKTLDECKKLWPNVKYNGRITLKDFQKVYGNAVSCPLLAKMSYLETGFMTPRIWEALIFGTIPIGLGNHNGIRKYLPEDLVARSSDGLGDIVDKLSRLSVGEREGLRKDVVQQIEFMDAKYFVETLERIADADGQV